MKKFLLPFIIFAFLVGLGLGYYFGFDIGFEKAAPEVLIKNFEECKAAGYQLVDRYPPTCETPDGKKFTQEVGNEMDLRNEIIVANPIPNKKIESPLTISGSAKGTWFFEANFSAELLDSEGALLGTAIITATKDWMTEDFVPFEGIMEYPIPGTSKGKLILKNANPSGMPENNKELVIPVEF